MRRLIGATVVLAAALAGCSDEPKVVTRSQVNTPYIVDAPEPTPGHCWSTVQPDEKGLTYHTCVD